MRNTRKDKRFDMWIRFIAGIGALSMIFACTTREQGCLDIYASNFELSAEKECDDCCLYPALNVSLSQLWGDVNLDVMEPVVDMDGDSFMIVDLKYFLSSWVLYGVNDDQYTVDSVLLSCTPPVVYNPDIIVADVRQFNYQLGIIRTAPDIDSLCVSLGLETSYPCILPDTTNAFVELTTRSPLWDPSVNALRTMRLVVQRDLQSLSLDTIYIDHMAREAFALPLTFERGKNTSLKVTVNYQQWFSGADAQDVNSFGPAIIAGFPGSIYATQ